MHIQDGVHEMEAAQSHLALSDHLSFRSLVALLGYHLCDYTPWHTVELLGPQRASQMLKTLKGPRLCRACRVAGFWAVSVELPRCWGGVRPDWCYCGTRQTVPRGEPCAAELGSQPRKFFRGGRFPSFCLRTPPETPDVRLSAPVFFLMRPKVTRTPRTLRGKSSLEAIGSKKERKQPVPPLKDQTGARERGAQQSAPMMEKTVRNAAQVPAIFTQIVKPKRTPLKKELCNAQSGTLDDNGDQVFSTGTGARGTDSPDKTGTLLKNSGNADVNMIDGRLSKEGATEPELGEISSNAGTCSLTQNAVSQEIEDTPKMYSTSDVKALSPSQRGKEDKLSGAKGDHGLADTVERFFSLSDQSKDSDSDEEIPLTDTDLECSSSASIWASNNLTCRRKSMERPSTRGNMGTRPRGVQPNDQDGAGELQWDYTATQQAFLKMDSTSDIPTCQILGISDQAAAPLLEHIYRTVVHNHEQAQKESRKAKIVNRQLQSSIKKVVKSCQGISTRIASMETRTEVLEIEVKVTAAQTATQGQQISDSQWKLDDAENR
ncbi:hypothetical protein NDU88_009196 [Pleurodeles waltl]|uniref:Uncharacterized protein n=1 Tax=Pleurodeles waltl TaxID=8319 RepID=A0AAV7QSW7_PLEWA|nr:hypothetical protein NDU88_009196 [Pleurodeles waltl]